ncbi:hypothetical protein WJX72_000775 [[Myrmecia] bisecta]|uniref:Protein phosphatase 1 regulatory subunit 7 n=1 Tax=[Myrmecia] bisecta TaxID=41462 RepID=A0AAW1PG87_9CHLO
MSQDGLVQTSQELDLTNSHLPSLEGVQLEPGLTSLDLTANRLRELEPKLLALKGLRKLFLRQNLLSDAAKVVELASAAVLEELVLQDNQLKQIPSFRGFSSLQRLELSYNEIRSLAPLTDLSTAHIQELYVASNKVTCIEGISQLTSLTLLELGSNRVSTIEGLDNLQQLQELWLGRNRITQIRSLSCLICLQRLSLQSNRLTSMLGLEACVTLEELYLSHNGITHIEGLSTLIKLQILDVSNNMIAEVAGLETLTELQDLWLNDNQIPSLAPLGQALRGPQQTLTCIYLQNNPATKDNAEYRQIMMDLLPCLKQLDSDYVRGGP